MKKLLLSLAIILVFSLSGCAMAEDPGEYEPTDPSIVDYVKEGYITDELNNIKVDGLSVIEKPYTNADFENTSTFSIDVDTASYSIFRKFLSNGQVPPSSDIRTEEMVNYFDYDYQQPSGNRPFSIETELGESPWNSDHDLLMIGIQGMEIAYEEAPSNNLVFLVDVSGSMRSFNKLDMVKESLALLVENLREEDYVSIVTYAGTAEIILNPTSGDQKTVILDALEGLQAGGGTNGSGGIEKAYDLAYQNFNFEGNNRVLLATDGDFNIGTTSSQGLIEIVREKAEIGIYLTILGFGQNHSAGWMMEQLSNDGQGTYHFIDTLQEADKVLNHEIASTIVPIADDVKIQIEFNEDIVQSYRLIGYENRVLGNDEFNDDNVDAGEMGAGHNVTAFYEIVYNTVITTTDDELATIRIRYKDVGEDVSQEVSGIVRLDDRLLTPSSNFLFASGVVEVSLLMRDSEFKADADFDQVIDRLEANIGDDPYGLREEFIDLVYTLQQLMDTRTQ